MGEPDSSRDWATFRQGPCVQAGPRLLPQTTLGRPVSPHQAQAQDHSGEFHAHQGGASVPLGSPGQAWPPGSDRPSPPHALPRRLPTWARPSTCSSAPSASPKPRRMLCRPSPCWPGTTPPSWWLPSWTSPSPWTGAWPALPHDPPPHPPASPRQGESADLLLDRIPPGPGPTEALLALHSIHARPRPCHCAERGPDCPPPHQSLLPSTPPRTPSSYLPPSQGPSQASNPSPEMAGILFLPPISALTPTHHAPAAGPGDMVPGHRHLAPSPTWIWPAPVVVASLSGPLAAGSGHSAGDTHLLTGPSRRALGVGRPGSLCWRLCAWRTAGLGIKPSVRAFLQEVSSPGCPVAAPLCL